VKLPDVDISPYLGAHHWAHFLKHGAPADFVSYVFEYNYRINGDPANRESSISFCSTGYTICNNHR
jgi:hypothetical protein